MANIFIIFASIIICILTFVGVGYLVIFYTHPDEKEYKSSWFYKIVVVRLSITRSSGSPRPLCRCF